MSNADELQKIQLTKAIAIHQRRRGHRTATDDVLCAWAGLLARPSASRALDLGAGHGSVTLMLAGCLESLTRLDAIEFQAISHALLVRNVADNDLTSLIHTYCGDLREVQLQSGDAGYDLITGSPPYMPLGSGVLPADPQRAGGRFELRGGVEDYLAAAARWLSPDGVASILMDGASRPRCLRAIKTAGLGLQHETVVYPREGAAARYRVYRCGRPANVSAPTTTTLTVRDDEGRWTSGFETVRAVLKLP
jgi:tRNA1Val (adenine37-N6)-methyltransferase